MPKLLAAWNPARSLWESTKDTPCLCGHSMPYSQTLPKSGMTRNGQLYELPTLVHRTGDSEYSLLPTPSASLGSNHGSQHPDKRRAGGHQVHLTDVVEHAADWEAYKPTLERWEKVTGRLAPPTTELTKTKHRLSPGFVEWLMGLPAGHVTNTPGLTRAQQLKALGNGVVPQQAATALTKLQEIRKEQE